MSTKYEMGPTGRTGYGNMAEWLRRLIRNQLEAIPREFESLCCRVFVTDLHLSVFIFWFKTGLWN